MGILLVSFQASDFQSGFVFLGGRTSVVMKAAVNVLTYVIQNGKILLGIAEESNSHVVGICRIISVNDKMDEHKENELLIL